MSHTAAEFRSDVDVLIVDDNKNNVRLLAEMLRTAGYTVRLANSGALALRSIRAKIPAIILLDIRMPDMDGYEVCRQLKADELTRDLPIIFISILENAGEKVKGFQVGGVDYITKPFSEAEVLARVNTHLALRHAQQRLERHADELEALNARLLDEIKERERKEMLMREILHRTKNNMTAIHSLLAIESMHIHDKDILRLFHDMQNRIHSMVMVQEKLYKSQDLAHFDLKSYFLDLASQIFVSLQIHPENISLTFEMDTSVTVSPKIAVPCGLILNELLTNALKYAFPDERQGNVTIFFHAPDEATLEFGVRDTGRGHSRRHGYSYIEHPWAYADQRIDRKTIARYIDRHPRARKRISGTYSS